MTSKSDVTSFDQMMRDMYPRAGEPTKQWVLDARAARAELERTGRRVAVAWHRDNCGDVCRNVGPSTLVHDMEHHDCCGDCNDIGAIEGGALPECLVGADWRLYAGGGRREPTWDGFARAWWDIAYVRLQGFERDGEARDL